jgi:hypothetical protein
VKEKIDRRRHQRHRVKDDVFAIMGSGASVMGRIQEMSEGGLSFTYRDNRRKKISIENITELSIISDTNGPDLNEPYKFNVKVISDMETEESKVFDSSKIKRTGIQFNKLTVYQKGWLVECMRKYIAGDGN